MVQLSFLVESIEEVHWWSQVDRSCQCPARRPSCSVGHVHRFLRQLTECSVSTLLGFVLILFILLPAVATLISANMHTKLHIDSLRLVYDSWHFIFSPSMSSVTAQLFTANGGLGSAVTMQLVIISWRACTTGTSSHTVFGGCRYTWA